jgi:twitching motility protein PilT
MQRIVSQLDEVLKKGTELGASDIHLVVGSFWKYRINGKIVTIKGLEPLSLEECSEIIKHLLFHSNAILPEDMERTLRTLRDYDTSYALEGISRFRVNICRQRGTYAVVFRIIPFESPTIEELGLPEIVRNIAHEERGLILVTGITGSGKSTTLAAMINEINHTKACKIITIEDPIEFLHREIKASVIQREVGSDATDFAVALRAALRQDPDVILVGEMRDRETIDIALKAAETGHLVLSTLHTTDAPRTIQRILSVFELSEQNALRQRLAEALKGVISQRLINRTDEDKRIAVVEIMIHTLMIQECIENPEKTGTIRDYIASGRNQYGMQTFDQHLMDLYRERIIDLETAKSAATSLSDFERAVKLSV